MNTNKYINIIISDLNQTNIYESDYRLIDQPLFVTTEWFTIWDFSYT